ncbi:MAG: MSCRAMM family protein, partial [Microbacterium sp.]
MTRLIGWLLAALLVVTGAVWTSDAARAADDVGTIAGTVADEHGAPVAGVEVTALRYTEEWGSWQWQSSTTSGDDGAYALADLVPGEYKLQFLAAASTGFVSEWWADALDEESAAPLTLEAGAILTDISPVLTLGGSISGAVTDAGRTPIENVTVTAFQPETMNASASVFTDAAGAYTLAGLPAGEYLVEFQTWNTGANLVGEWWDDAARPENATRVTVAVAEDAGGVDAALALGNSVSGVVTDSDGSPLPSVVVDLFTATGEYVSAAWTDGDGAYTVGGLPDGEYRIRFNPENSSVDVAGEWWDDAAAEEDAAVVNLSGGANLIGISPQLDPAAVVTGTVTDASGALIAQATVSAYTYDDEAGGWWTWAASTVVAEDGTFVLGSLRPGSYKIQVTAGTDEVLGEWWPDAADE